MAIDFEKNNQDIKTWTKDSINRMQATGSGMGIEHRSGSPSSSASLPKLKDQYRLKLGSIQRISIKFPRSLIWTMKGAGKGMGGSKGSRWTDKYGNIKKTNTAS